jgi:F420-dependent oxidoreductase-like protein
VRICLMVEGQEGVTWENWRAIAESVEKTGLEGLFRSDHYSSVRGIAELGSLDAWATLAGLAVQTSRIRLGTLVSPASFRHPSVLARTVVTVDHISQGRVELGMGAGWFEDEHLRHGFEFHPTATRMAVLEEQIEIVHRSWTEGELKFDGKHYELSGGAALPKPIQDPHPPLIVGGSGGRRSLALAARWADEYNTLIATTDECRARREALSEACKKEGRKPGEVKLSLMCTAIVGRDEAEVRDRAAAVLKWRGGSEDLDAFIAESGRRRVVGTIEQVRDRMDELEGAGVERVMLQHLIHDDLEMIELLGDLL